MAFNPDDLVFFVGPGLTFFESQQIPVQAQLVGIAAALYHDPKIDGETKFMMPIPAGGGVSVFGRVYIGSRYWMHFETEDEPPKLTVYNCGTIPIQYG